MNIEDYERGVKLIQTKADRLSKDYEIVTENNNSVATRLVWFVAIAGFALININSLAENIIGEKLIGMQLIFLILPWVLVTISGIATHYLLGELRVSDNIQHVLIQHGMRSWLAGSNAKISSNEEILKILRIDTEDAEINSIKKKTERLSKNGNMWEKTTLFLLMISFIWSIIYPILILTW